MDDNTKSEIKEAIKASITKFFKGKTVKNTHVLDPIFPKERRIRSLIGGLETSIGTTVWESTAKVLAKKNGFEVLNKNILRPDPFPNKLRDILAKEKDRRNEPGANIPIQECVEEIRKVCHNIDRSDLVFVEPRKGKGVDIYLKKGEQEIVFDIKTNQLNKGGGFTHSDQLLEWYAYRLCENPDAIISAHIAFPFNPNKKAWLKVFGSRAYPLQKGSDALVEDEFWDMIYGKKNTWSHISSFFHELGQEDFGDQFSWIFEGRDFSDENIEEIKKLACYFDQEKFIIDFNKKLTLKDATRNKIQNAKYSIRDKICLSVIGNNSEEFGEFISTEYRDILIDKSESINKDAKYIFGSSKFFDQESLFYGNLLKAKKFIKDIERNTKRKLR